MIVHLCKGIQGILIKVFKASLAQGPCTGGNNTVVHACYKFAYVTSSRMLQVHVYYKFKYVTSLSMLQGEVCYTIKYVILIVSALGCTMYKQA